MDHNKVCQEKKDERPKNETAQIDTTKQPKAEKSARYSRKSVTVIGEDGKPNETITEEFEGDESLRPFVIIPNVSEVHEFEAFAFVPNIPDFEMVPPIPDMSHVNFEYTFDSSFDTLGPNMGNFSAEFEKMFSERFSDFYKNHEEEISKMMQELNEKMQDSNLEFNFHDNIVINKKMIEQQVAQIEKINMQQHKMQMQKMEEQMHKDQEHNMERMNEKMRKMEINMQAFENELRDQLLKDGYLKKDEKIKNLHFDQDGNIEINGTKIKEKDKPKYKAIQDKFHTEKKGDFRIVE